MSKPSKNKWQDLRPAANLVKVQKALSFASQHSAIMLLGAQRSDIEAKNLWNWNGKIIKQVCWFGPTLIPFLRRLN
jgi:hypothetical protein